MGAGQLQQEPAMLILAKHGFPTDSEMVGLVKENLNAFTPEGLEAFLEAQKRLDRVVNVVHEDGTEERVESWNLRRNLRVLPSVMQSAERANLSYEVTHNLLMHTLGSVKYNFTDESTHLSLLGRVLGKAADKDIDVSSNIAELSDLIGVSGEYGVMDSSLYSLSISLGLGIDIPRASRMLKKLPDADGDLSGYTFPHFQEALKSLHLAEVDPEIVERAFDLLGGKRPYFSGANYDALAQIITFGCPIKGIKPNDFLKMFINRFERGKGKALEGLVKEVTSEEDSTQSPEDYFISTSGKLEHAALPYRNHRPLSEGIKDLAGMVSNKWNEWEEVGEGMWVFDPESETWYSLGGKLNLQNPGRVRHEFITYDISKLSDSPIMFHIHPERLEFMIAPQEEALSVRKLKKKITKFLSATPSRADYEVIAQLMDESSRTINPQSYIVHSSGITEVKYPNDVKAVRSMSERSRDIRDGVMLDFDALGYYVAYGDREPDAHFIGKVLELHNSKLPEGFEINLHPFP